MLSKPGGAEASGAPLVCPPDNPVYHSFFFSFRSRHLGTQTRADGKEGRSTRGLGFFFLFFLFFFSLELPMHTPVVHLREKAALVVYARHVRDLIPRDVEPAS